MPLPEDGPGDRRGYCDGCGSREPHDSNLDHKNRLADRPAQRLRRGFAQGAPTTRTHTE
jgi:hypothetical protein